MNGQYFAQTLIQLLFSLDDNLLVQIIPSTEVITLFDPFKATATNIEHSGDQHTLRHSLVSFADTLPVQFVPSGEVITLFVPP
jgi:hypothetical protein